MTFMPFNPLLCDELDLAWYDGFNLPQFRTVEVIDIQILEIKEQENQVLRLDLQSQEKDL